MSEVKTEDEPCSVATLQEYWLKFVEDKFVPKVFDFDTNLIEIRNVWKGFVD